MYILIYKWPSLSVFGIKHLPLGQTCTPSQTGYYESRSGECLCGVCEDEAELWSVCTAGKRWKSSGNESRFQQDGIVTTSKLVIRHVSFVDSVVSQGLPVRPPLSVTVSREQWQHTGRHALYTSIYTGHFRHTVHVHIIIFTKYYTYLALQINSSSLLDMQGDEFSWSDRNTSRIEWKSRGCDNVQIHSAICVYMYMVWVCVWGGGGGGTGWAMGDIHPHWPCNSSR